MRSPTSSTPTIIVSPCTTSSSPLVATRNIGSKVLLPGSISDSQIQLTVPVTAPPLLTLSASVTPAIEAVNGIASSGVPEIVGRPTGKLLLLPAEPAVPKGTTMVISVNCSLSMFLTRSEPSFPGTARLSVTRIKPSPLLSAITPSTFSTE